MSNLTDKIKGRLTMVSFMGRAGSEEEKHTKALLIAVEALEKLEDMDAPDGWSKETVSEDALIIIANFMEGE